MTIPDFTNRGNLPEGVHKCNGVEFIDKFCNSKERESYKKAITDLFDFAAQTNAVYVFVGGSFVASTDMPHDIDCLMVYEEDAYVPKNIEKIKLGNIRLDVMFASLDHMHIVHAFIHLLSRNKVGAKVGLIEVDLFDENEEWQIVQPGIEEYEIVKRAYINREVVDISPIKGIIVTIHGLYSHAVWNQQIAPIVSSRGWIFAPYLYDYQNFVLLFKQGKRKKIVEDFREWIYNLWSKYDNQQISVIAHSFGTYILAAYLDGFDRPPVGFNSIVLTGSIINTNFDWQKNIIKKGAVARIHNEIATNDEFVRYMPDKDFKKFFGIDPLMGDSGVKGFSTKLDGLLTQSNSSIFDHNNVIKTDVIEQKWMPFFEANKNAANELLAELINYSLKARKNDS
ncbi:hypothetical protein ASD24_01815 [Paenibacillus sp. Root52]|uniref:Pimeloyl-ACP methyl ester carboxylesterase n=1 Tax=Paenibacillus amylolyticus TaxID=1451 RepID=A0AAP5LNN6_PAEAM|nr:MULTISPECIES: alpha/beta hydrolase [Paenibacillus]KQY94322.1 hypothetical protein ASD24_01815 [Paenibacillus sp. Root52]MDR6721699.1 pimeloyl-ACP methyl ester carboxylesterase [Paenibacillus amylolyticus]